MKIADYIALARAGYKMKDIQALEEKEEKEKAEENKSVEVETKPEETPDDKKENETPESGSDELSDLKAKIEGFEKEKEELKAQLEKAQKEIRERDLSPDETNETLEDIIRSFCED